MPPLLYLCGEKRLNMDAKKKILVVDDEDTLCEALRFNLEIEGFEVMVAHSAEEVLTMNITDVDLILLDVMMGEISGFALAQILKQRPDTANIPIIFCTAKDQEDDMIAGLNIGADDYIYKPYTLRNVIARVRTVLRRAQVDAPAEPVIRFEELEVNNLKKTCTVDGEEITLPRKEFEILWLLISNIGTVFSREQILKRIWPDEVVVLDRVVDVNITRLRQKIGRYGRNIITRSGFGYGFKI